MNSPSHISKMTLLMVIVIGIASSGVMFADKAMVEIDNTRAALERWVETRRTISQEQRDLELSKQTLNDRIELVQREIDALHTKIEDANKSIADADKKRQDMMSENEMLKAASAGLNEMVAGLESRTKIILKRLPDPIRDLVKPLSQRIPEKPEDTKMTLSERFQNVVGILNEINKFNRNITVASEVRSLPDGKSAEVTAMYVGLGQGYYVSANRSVAGIGTATADGWVWTPANESANAIADAIAILKNEKVASFVKLPITVK
ncbi:MAG: DUF3450 family protein [Planctomycetes bacterium]|nr:DUF3450 family protein [Planctomycetota bacterium]